MLKVIDNLLSTELANEIYTELQNEEWREGVTKNPEYKKQVKQNLELRKTDSLIAAKNIKAIEKALVGSMEYQRAAFPYKQVNPRFNCCKDGGSYGKHADSAIMNVPPIRSDLSMTIFLTPPEDYEGGELEIQDIDGKTISFKGEQGSAVLYPSYYVHQVKPVTKGKRICCILWIQSMIRDESKRALLTRLLKLGETIQLEQGFSDLMTETASIYNNLFRMWCENG